MNAPLSRGGSSTSDGSRRGLVGVFLFPGEAGADVEEYELLRGMATPATAVGVLDPEERSCLLCCRELVVCSTASPIPSESRCFIIPSTG